MHRNVGMRWPYSLVLGGEAWMQLEGNYGVLDADDGWKYLMLEA